MPTQTFISTDGGRSAAGFKGETGDCAARSIAIAVGIPYREAYDRINAVSETENGRYVSNARLGTYRKTMDRVLADLGWEWIPTMKIGQGCTVHLRADELPPGRIIARLSKHYVAVVDGIVYDTHDCSRDGSRCVYGYWREVQAD